MAAYYNEHDPKMAAWLRALIRAGHIADGEVDERSIEHVRPDDLRGFRQCHFFAGIGGWSYALRLAGWPDDRMCWTGSNPCQPHSSAARGRHVAADMRRPFTRLIEDGRPPVVFGEQVDEAGAWLDAFAAEVEGIGYAFWPVVLPAYCLGFDHARERFYFACYTDRQSQSSRAINGEVARVPRPRRDTGELVLANGVLDRVALMRGFGNAIVPQVAAEFIAAYMDTAQ